MKATLTAFGSWFHPFMWLSADKHLDTFDAMKHNLQSKLAAGVFSAVLLLTACNKESIRGGGASVTEQRNIPSFTQVQLDGDAAATITYGTTQKVSVTGYGNLVPVYETKLIAGVLHLRFKEGHRIRNSNIRVAIEIPTLSYLRVNGSGNMTARNFSQGDMLEAYVNGSGDLLVEQSQFNKAVYQVNGSGILHANTTEAINVNAEIHGSGKIDLRVSGELDASISGSGVIDYWGNPAAVNTQVSGSGRINKK